MGWILVVWLNTPTNFTIYEQFQSQEQCLAKYETVQKALTQANSKMGLECRKRKIGDRTNKSDIVVKRYVLY